MHITSRQAWTEAQGRGVYQTPSLEQQGFIHLSELRQVVAVANFLYRGHQDLVLLCVLPDKLTADLRYEALGTDETYPHLYGPLNLAAVVEVVDFPTQIDGTFKLLEDVEEVSTRFPEGA